MVYYFLSFLFTLTGTYSQVKFGRSVKNVFDLLIFSLITGCIASVFFFIMSGFCIRINSATLVYSLIFSLIVAAIHFLNLLLFRVVDVSTATVLTSTLALILTFITGTLFLSEKAGIPELLRGAVMVAASVLLYFPAKNGENIKSRFKAKGIIISLLIASARVSASVISNLFSKDPKVTDSNSFFFMTNIFVVVFALSAIFIIKKGSFVLLLSEIKSFSAKGYALTGISTVSSNVCSLLQILIFASGDGITLYTPISGAFGLVAAAIISLIEKEKPKMIPLALACASLFIGLLQQKI